VCIKKTMCILKLVVLSFLPSVVVFLERRVFMMKLKRKLLALFIQKM